MAWRDRELSVPCVFRLRAAGVTLSAPPFLLRRHRLRTPASDQSLQLHVLGTVEFTGAESAHELLAQPKRLAVLVFLVLARPHGFQRRDRVAALFWPEQSDFHARAALRKSLHGIRQSLGDEVLVTRGDDEVGINRDRLWCDAPAFDSAIGNEQFARALELFRGELLEGFFPDAPGFEQWLGGERQRFHEAAGQAAWTLAERYEKGSDLTLATRWARKAAKLAGSDERRIRRVIALLDRAGDRAGAVRVYEEFATYLRSELDIEPSAETQALVKVLRESRG
jgi:DNA-binding SARP family transcriptional activator